MSDKPLRDYAATVRDAAVEVLICYGTPAEDRVQAERIDPISSGDTPRIAVFGMQEAETDSKAGTAPSFKNTLTLVVQCVAEAARQQDALRLVDAMGAQAKDALFCDPAWVKLTENLTTARTDYKLKGEDRLIIAEARLTITCSWRETYKPRIDTLLTGVTLNVPVAANALSGATVGADIDLT